MALGSLASFRKGAAGFVTAGLLAASALGGFGNARAETVAAKSPLNSSTKVVPPGECAAFFHYVADELRAYPNDLSKPFLASVMRFKKAGCASQDQDGPIQIVTMTNQDAASLRTSLRLMGCYDIIGISGVKGCHRPTDGVCPTSKPSASAASPRSGS